MPVSAPDIGKDHAWRCSDVNNIKEKKQRPVKGKAFDYEPPVTNAHTECNVEMNK